MTIHRGEIKNAPYNPRVLSEEERGRLRASLVENGLVEPPIWNARTGNLVGGHQRLSIIDQIEGTREYLLHVARIDVDDTAEKRLNVVLNNPNTQGSYDLGKLGELFKADSEGVEKMGFSKAEVYQMFGSDVAGLNADGLADLADQIRKSKELHDKIAAANSARDETEFYLVVFAGNAERFAFTEALGLPDNRYVDGSKLMAAYEKTAKPTEGGV